MGGQQILFDEGKVNKIMRVSHIEESEDGMPKFIFELYLGDTRHVKMETDIIIFDEFMQNFLREQLHKCSCVGGDKCQE